MGRGGFGRKFGLTARLGEMQGEIQQNGVSRADFADADAFTPAPHRPCAMPLAALAAVLDRLFGEPARFHPLVGFGQLASALENA